MDDLVFVLRLINAGVLIVSGVAKLFDREGSEEAMIGFGVPERLLRPVAISLPWLELALAIGLLFGPTVLWSAALAMLLFIVFSVGVMRIVLSGDQIECHCFGQLQSSPVSWWTVARNLALVVASATIWWLGDSVAIWHGRRWIELGLLIITVLVAALVWVILQQRRTNLQLHQQIEELVALVPPHRLQALHGSAPFSELTAGMELTDDSDSVLPASSLHRRGKPTLLIFVSSTCRACTMVLPLLSEWQQQFDGMMTIRPIGAGEGMADLFIGQGISQFALRESDDLTNALKVNGQPTAVLIDHDGVVRQKPVLGRQNISNLVDGLKAQAGIA